MLFNSHLFLFVFLPVTLAGWDLLGRVAGRRMAAGWLVAMSLLFYGWWDPSYLWLFGASMGGNFLLGSLQCRAWTRTGERGSRGQLALGIAANLALLGWYKYANFAVDTFNGVWGCDVHLQKLVLPLGISFFTFQQIGYLVDAYRGKAREYSFLDYCLFVSFFPQHIAGPIVQHGEVMPQFARSPARLEAQNLPVGCTLLAIGLFKKVVLADTLSRSASPVFAAAEQSQALSLLEAWGGCLAYAGQLYFDFSGYSDMAIGSARMFGITLPANFAAPIRSRSIIELWRRWHMTLSRFLREYVFRPLCGRKPGVLRRRVALFVTMTLAGLWHGAGWTFVAFGACHGAFLVVNHGWREATARWGWKTPGAGLSFSYGVLTFLCFLFSVVIFRAADLGTAGVVLKGMVGTNGIDLPRRLESHLAFVSAWGVGFAKTSFPVEGFVFVPLALLLIFFFPTTQHWMRDARPVLENTAEESRLRWRPTLLWALYSGALFAVACALLTNTSEFQYWNF